MSLFRFRYSLMVLGVLALAVGGCTLFLHCSAQTRRPTSVQAGSRSPGIRSDREFYPESVAPPLPRAGGKVIDPTFGTEIMRVTDETGGGNAGTSYSYWPTFNCDNTRLLVMREEVGSGQIYDFDPEGFMLGNKHSIASVPGGGSIRGEDAIWSSTDPNVLYGHGLDTKLWAYDVARNSFRLIGDLGPFLGKGEYIYQMSKSEDDDVFAFTRRGPPPAYAFIGWIVYRASTKKIIAKAAVSPLDEVQVDKSGRYLVVKLDPSFAPGVIRTHIIDLQTKADTELTWGPPDNSCGHSDNGRGVVFGGDDQTFNLTKRVLSNPHSFTPFFRFGAPLGTHFSALANDENWILVSTYGDSRTPFRGELVQIKTDGSEAVRRLAHHHSVYRVYEDSPRANISRDGRFVAFTSNWGGRNRRDLFIARIEPPAPSRPRRATSPN